MRLRSWIWILLAAWTAWGQAPPADPPARNRTGRESSGQPARVRRDDALAAQPGYPAPPDFANDRLAASGSASSVRENEFLPFTSYRVGPEDLLSVTVLDSPEFSRQVRVNGEGMIRLPLVRQAIPAAGKTTAELEQTIAGVLIGEELLREPAVSVTVREFHSKPVTVTGAVRAPLVFQALRPLSLTEALSRAGGVSEDAGGEVLVTVPEEGRPASQVRVPLRSVLEGSDPKANLLLRGGEEVRVPSTGRVFIIGSVSRPGPVSLGEGQPLSLLQAVAMAGGPLATATKKAYLLRPADGGATHREIPFDLKKLMTGREENLVLQANDVIFVPDSRLRRLAAGVGPAAANSVIYTTLGVLLWR